MINEAKQLGPRWPLCISSPCLAWIHLPRAENTRAVPSQAGSRLANGFSMSRIDLGTLHFKAPRDSVAG